jgi:hypothetical protein
LKPESQPLDSEKPHGAFEYFLWHPLRMPGGWLQIQIDKHHLLLALALDSKLPHQPFPLWQVSVLLEIRLMELKLPLDLSMLLLNHP